MEHNGVKIYNLLHSMTVSINSTDKACAEIVEIPQKSPVPKATGNRAFLPL